MPTTATEWIAWGGVVLPFAGLAGSAVRFVWLEGEKRKDANYQRFYDLMDQIGRPGHSIAAKMAAVYELRKFPDYAEVSIRVCEDVPVGGDAAKPLADEMKLTAEFLRRKTGK